MWPPRPREGELQAIADVMSVVSRPPPLCGAIPASSDYVAKPGDKVAARVKAVDGDEQWILAEVVSYSHAANK